MLRKSQKFIILAMVVINQLFNLGTLRRKFRGFQFLRSQVTVCK